MQAIRGSLLAVAAAVLFSACQTAAPPTCDTPKDPDVAICELRAAWQSAPGCQLYSGAPCASGGETRSRAMVRRQAENLAFRYPDHIDTRMFCGILAYEAENPVDATRHLDHVLRIRPDTPEAAVLRARIAMEDGNTQYAVRVLEDMRSLRPDSYSVREGLASAYYMNEQHELAHEAIDSAERLGAPAWRISYNRGLLAELDGELPEAYVHYRDAIAQAPDWNMPRERMEGLSSIAGFDVPAPPPAEPAPSPVPAPAPPASIAAKTSTAAPGAKQSAAACVPFPPPVRRSGD